MDDMYVPKTQKALFGVIALWIGGFLLLALVIGLISWGVGWVSAPWQGKLQARQQIQSGDFRIQAYTQFFDLCAAVQTTDQALNQSYDDLARATDPSDRSRIATNITAQLNNRNDAANQYNVKTHEGYTVGQFKSSNLPYELGAYTKGEVTTCTS